MCSAQEVAAAARMPGCATAGPLLGVAATYQHKVVDGAVHRVDDAAGEMQGMYNVGVIKRKGGMKVGALSLDLHLSPKPLTCG